MRGRSHGDVGAMGAIKYTLHGHDRCFRASAKCSVERRSSIRNDLAGIAEDFALLLVKIKNFGSIQICTEVHINQPNQ